MSPNSRPEATIFIIFGFAGDLTWRKAVPALYNLFLENRRPEPFAILGVGHMHMSDKDFRGRLKQGVDQFSGRGKARNETWDRFIEQFSFMPGELNEPEKFINLAKDLANRDQKWQTKANRVFYLALPPQRIEMAPHLSLGRSHFFVLRLKRI